VILVIATYKNTGIQLKTNPKNSQGRKVLEIQTKDMGNLFNEIIAENSPTLCNAIDTPKQQAF
jgi:hypothetical protein